MQSANIKSNGRDFTRALSESRRAKDEVDKLAEAIRQARLEWEGVLRQLCSERPYTTLAAAAGVGYVIGGGLTPAVIRSLASTGSRLALGVVLQRLVGASGLDSTQSEME